MHAYIHASYIHTYIYTYIRTYIHTYTHTYTHTQIRPSNLSSMHVHACMHACMHAPHIMWVCVSMHVCWYVGMYVCMYVRMCVCNTYTCVCVCAHAEVPTCLEPVIQQLRKKAPPMWPVLLPLQSMTTGHRKRTLRFRLWD